ncbi:hypothetical protein D3C86_1772980 [compost metagenome]
MRRHREPVPEARLHHAQLEHLSHHFQRIDRLLRGLRREPVHQVRMHHDARLRERIRHTRHLRNGHAFFHTFEQAIGGHFKPA